MIVRPHLRQASTSQRDAPQPEHRQELGDAQALAELEERADDGDSSAQKGLARLLKERGDAEALAERIDAGNRSTVYRGAAQADSDILRRRVYAAEPGAAEAVLYHYRRQSPGDHALQLDVNARPKPWSVPADNPRG